MVVVIEGAIDVDVAIVTVKAGGVMVMATAKQSS